MNDHNQTSTCGTRRLLSAAMACAAAMHSLAEPVPSNATAGVVFNNPASGVTNITAPDNAIIDYASFNLGTGETVNFIQPGAAARVLNRINSNTPSQIDGTINANGIVYFVNPAGVQFGPTSVIDAAGLFAAGGSLSDNDFINGNHAFTSVTGEVTARGIIRADTIAALIGRSITNTGTISVPNGTVVLAAGGRVLLGQPLGGIMVSVDAGPLADGSNGVNQDGVVDAAEISLVAGDLASLAMQNTDSLTTSAENAKTPSDQTPVVTIPEIDTDGDGDIDFDDIDTAVANFTGPLPFGTGGKTQQQGDTDGDGDVDNTDIGTLIIYFTGATTPPVGPPPEIADAASLDSIGEFEPITEFVNIPEADLDILRDQLGIAVRQPNALERVDEALRRSVLDDFGARGGSNPEGPLTISNRRLDHDVVREALAFYKERINTLGTPPADHTVKLRQAFTNAYQQYVAGATEPFNAEAFAKSLQQSDPELVGNMAALNELRRMTLNMGLNEAEKANSEQTIINGAKPQALSFDQMKAVMQAASALLLPVETPEAG